MMQPPFVKEEYTGTPDSGKASKLDWDKPIETVEGIKAELVLGREGTNTYPRLVVVGEDTLHYTESGKFYGSLINSELDLRNVLDEPKVTKLDWDKPLRTKDGRKAVLVSKNGWNGRHIVLVTSDHWNRDFAYDYDENGSYYGSFHKADLENAPEEAAPEEVGSGDGEEQRRIVWTIWINDQPMKIFQELDEAIRYGRHLSVAFENVTIFPMSEFDGGSHMVKSAMEELSKRNKT